MTTDFDAYERDLWAGKAAVYENGFARVTIHTAPLLLDAAGVGAGVKVLEIGTGPGLVARAAVERGAEVTAVDADPEMAEVAAANASGARVEVAVLPSLPFADETFDAVVGNYVINHVGDPPATLRELRRVLRPAGRVALTCWDYENNEALQIVGRAMEEAGVVWPDDVPTPPFREYAETEVFAGLLTDAGFAGTSAEEVRWKHRVTPEEWWRLPMERVGSNGVVLARQDPATLAAVRAAFDRIIAVHSVGDGIVALPALALLARGTKP